MPTSNPRILSSLSLILHPCEARQNDQRPATSDLRTPTKKKPRTSKQKCPTRPITCAPGIPTRMPTRGWCSIPTVVSSTSTSGAATSACTPPRPPSPAAIGVAAASARSVSTAPRSARSPFVDARRIRVGTSFSVGFAGMGRQKALLCFGSGSGLLFFMGNTRFQV